MHGIKPDKYKDKPEFISSQYGDLFDGEKVSQLTSSTFGQDSESESEEEQKREPQWRWCPNLWPGLHPDLCHQTTDEHDEEEEDKQIHFVNV